MQTAHDWTDTAPEGACLATDAPVPLYRLQAAEDRAQRDRMLLLLLAFCAVAMAASMA